MPTYTNGNIPYSLLVTFNRGYNSTDGNWDHSLSPATYARHRELVRLAKARTGRDLAISSGWSAYRPYAAQVLARKIWGNGAAVPGTSSHGGFWEGRQTLAMDYGNWESVYSGKGGRDAFWADARAAGLTPGMIMRSRGYPDEPWHVIDLNPWSAVPQFAGGGATPFPLPGNKEQDEDMPINFRNGKTGVTYTMVPGILISAHANNFGNRMTMYIQTGGWPGESTQELFNAGLRDLNADHVTWMLPLYGFGRFNSDTLPTSGTVYADKYEQVSTNVADVQSRVRGPQTQPYDMLQGINTGVQSIATKPGATVSDAQIAAIAAAVSKSVGTANVDNAAIAKAVREAFKADPLK